MWGKYLFYFFQRKKIFLILKFRKINAMQYHNFCVQAGCIFSSMIGWTLQHRKIYSFCPNSLTYFPKEIISYCKWVARDINVMDKALSSLGRSSVFAGSYSGDSVKVTLAMQTSANSLWAHIEGYHLSLFCCICSTLMYPYWSYPSRIHMYFYTSSFTKSINAILFF